MKIRYKLFVSMLLCIITVFLNSYSVLAFQNDEITKQKEINIPENLFLSTSDICDGHENFEQADVNSKGEFVIMTSSHFYDKGSRQNIFRIYVDIYNSSGQLVKELSFKKCTCAVRIADDAVYVIFLKNVLTYDIDSGEMHFYDTRSMDLWVDDGKNILQTRKFICGDSTYKMTKNLFSEGKYNKLIKYTSGTKEVVAESLTDYNDFIRSCVYAVILIAGGILNLMFIINRVRHKQSKAKRSDQ